VYHETGEGLFSYNTKGRPSKEVTKKRLETPELIEKEIAELRKSLKLPNEKLLMLVSLATDDMVRLVAMHPEVYFMDVTPGTNRQRRDLFLMAIRTPTGETFPGNLTVIPSGRRWVFHCIYQLAFIALYGAETCSRNCLALCDEDNSEYGPFENCIRTVPAFGNNIRGIQGRASSLPWRIVPQVQLPASRPLQFPVRSCICSGG